MINLATNRPLSVFLCHASNDKPAVRKLYRRLATDGYAPWLDEEDLLPGEDWRREIPKAVCESDVVLVCLSHHSINKKGYVQKEIKFALDEADKQPDGTIYLIPLRLEECEVPERLSHVQWVNLYDEGGYMRLLLSLQVRARELGLSKSPTASLGLLTSQPIEKSDVPATALSISGGVELDANTATVDGDVVGRDKIVQLNHIEHLTIIQAESPVGANKATSSGSTNNHRVIDGLEFVHIPAGKFLMGSATDNQLAEDNERPQHTVEIPYDYWISKYLITNEQFAKFVMSAKYTFTSRADQSKKASHPVTRVSWYDVIMYCKWLDETLHDDLEGLSLRLPTEAEWEKAARGTQGNEWPWGNEFDRNKCCTYKSGTTAVGVHSPQGDSPYGVADMAGNVWEWCHSLYRPYPYQLHDGREDKATPDARVLRGGSWTSDGPSTRSAYRYWLEPIDFSNRFGFRVVLSCSL